MLESIKNDSVKRIDGEGDVADSGAEARPNDSLKNLALKILVLKTAAFLKWNLDVWEAKLPLKIQICLLQDLFYFTNDKTDIPNVPECDVTTVSDPLLFALILYHRWIVRLAVQQSVHSKVVRPAGDVPRGSIEEFFALTPELVASSIGFLDTVLTLSHFPQVLTFDTFKMLSEDTKEVGRTQAQ